MDVLLYGFYEGIVWFPIVLATGIIYTYLKEIDVSIDGIVIISGISFVSVYNWSNSIVLSIVATAITAAICYSLLFTLLDKLRIKGLLGGIIFTLFLHSLSVLLIIESINLNYEDLVLANNNLSTVIISLCFGLLIEFYLRSKTGIAIAVSAGNPRFNSKIGSRNSTLLIYLIAGLSVSVGTVLYTSRLGMARSGGGFEFLITSLSSFLFIERILEYLIKQFKKLPYSFYLILKSPVIKAFLGSTVFQIIVLAIISSTSNPIYWKMIFSILLVLMVADYRFQLSPLNKELGMIKSEFPLTIRGISFSYKTAYTDKSVFKKLDLSLHLGLNILWGDNGSGKSTLLKLISGELTSDEGVILHHDKNLLKIRPHKRNIFSISQNPQSSLNGSFPVIFNRISADPKNYLETDFSKTSKLNKHQITGTLSGGQSQLLNIELCKIYNPAILLGDEPTSGMDSENFENFLVFIEKIANEGKVILIVTHDIRFKEIKCNHINLTT